MPMSCLSSRIPRQPTAAYPNQPAERARRQAVKLRWSSRLIHCIRAPQHCNALRPPSNVIFLGQSAALTAVHSISTIHLKSTNLYRQTSHFVRGIAERSNSSAASHAQSSAPSQRNCRSFRAQKKKPAAADELHMLKTGLEPVRIAPRDFKSPASAISPLQPMQLYDTQASRPPRFSHTPRESPTLSGQDEEKANATPRPRRRVSATPRANRRRSPGKAKGKLMPLPDRATFPAHSA